MFPTKDWGTCVENGVATLKCLPVAINNIATFLILFSSVIAVFLIVYSGIKFVNSHGDPQAVESARKTLTYAIIGLVFIVMCFFILKVLVQVTGVQQLTKPTFEN